MLTIRNAAVITTAILALMDSAVAGGPQTASTVNTDTMPIMTREALAARFPEMNEQEVDKLLFRIADARSMVLLLGPIN
jgi:hypothetical protein